jgi:hypothetical protein
MVLSAHTLAAGSSNSAGHLNEKKKYYFEALLTNYIFYIANSVCRRSGALSM